MQKIVSGIQATNSLTLGNYIGAIKSFVDLQEGNSLIIFIADYHSITNDFEPSKLKKMRKDVAKVYLASGISSEKTLIFNQSDVPEHTELFWILTCHTNLGQLSRMTQFKDKSKKHEANKTVRIPSGLLLYPVLMAADILLYSPDLVPVGFDQKQHLELTKNIASSFNSKYGNDAFKIPNLYFSKNGKKIMDLQNPEIKMSKSNEKVNGTIFLLDELEITRKKILSAKTDNYNKVNFDIVNQPGISNLINIYASLANLSIEDVAEKFKNFNYKDFKENVAELVCNDLKKIQDNYNLINDYEIEKILKIGAVKAKKMASDKIIKIKKIIGVYND